jgi:hypothetical protein
LLTFWSYLVPELLNKSIIRSDLSEVLKEEVYERSEILENTVFSDIGC